MAGGVGAGVPVTRSDRSSSWGSVVLACLLFAACRGPTPVLPLTPGPPGEDQQRFSTALFSIYHHARPAAVTADEPGRLRLMVLGEAASIVAEDAATFGDVWRVLAITQLAAADIAKFQDAIVRLAEDKPEAPRRLRRLLQAHPGAERLARERIVYEFLLGPQTFLTLSPTSQPDCPHTYPTVAPTHDHGVATAAVTVWVQKPLADLAANMDPQRWDNPCGKILFNATYLTDLKSGEFEFDPSYDAKPGTPEPVGQTWGPRYLFEYFLPGAGSNFFKNVLRVETELRSDGYAVKLYDLENSVRTRIAPDPERDGGLLADEGMLSATVASAPWTLLQGTKTIRFDTFPSSTPAQLASDAATTLKVLGTGFAYWACCPK